jgi:hypothetical protein
MPISSKTTSEQQVSWGEFFKELYNTGVFPKGSSLPQELVGVPTGLAMKYGKEFKDLLTSQMYARDKDPEKMTQLAMYGLGMGTPGGSLTKDISSLGMTKLAFEETPESVAKDLGIIYNGIWEGSPGNALTFTDTVSGGTFLVNSIKDVQQRLFDLRSSFGGK